MAVNVLLPPPTPVETQELLIDAPETPAQFLGRLERDENLSAPISAIRHGIERKVPGAAEYPAVLQELFGAGELLAAAFPTKLRDGVATAMRELATDAVHAVGHHIANGNATEIALPLSNGSEVHTRFAGTQPLETLHALNLAVSRIHAVMSDEQVQTVRVVEKDEFTIYRFIDKAHPGEPAVHVYIRPYASTGFDKRYEYGKRGGVDPSISFNVDIRPLHQLAKRPFISQVEKNGPYADSLLSLRIDRDGYDPEDWQNRLNDHDALIEQGTASFDGGSVLGGNSLSGRVGQLLAAGNLIRTQHTSEHTRLNHVPAFADAEGHSEGFAAGAQELQRELERRKLEKRELDGALSVIAPQNFASEHFVQPAGRIDQEATPAQYETAQEVIERAAGQRSFFERALLDENSVLHRLIARRAPDFDFAQSSTDGSLLTHAADILAPSVTNKARWEVLQDEAKHLTPDEERYFLDNAEKFGFVTTKETRAAAAAIPRDRKAVLIEGGANVTSVVRRKNARQLVSDDPHAVLYQSGSGRHIPHERPNGSLNPEYKVVTSQEVAGDVLPAGATGYSEYQVNVASALREGWQADIKASYEMKQGNAHLEDAAVLRATNAPDVISIKPQPALHGRATTRSAIASMAAMGALEDKDTLLIATTAQYGAKATLGAAQELQALGLPHVRVRALGMPGECSAKAYMLETAVLMRMLADLEPN